MNISQAIKISKIDTKREDILIEEAPTYYPTVEEFSDCMTYVKRYEKFCLCCVIDLYFRLRMLRDFNIICTYLCDTGYGRKRQNMGYVK